MDKILAIFVIAVITIIVLSVVADNVWDSVDDYFSRDNIKSDKATSEDEDKDGTV